MGLKVLEGNHFLDNPYHAAVVHWKNAFADGAGCLRRVFEGWAASQVVLVSHDLLHVR